MDRARDFVVSTPFVTLALLFVNVFVHIAVFLFTIDISPFTFSPYFVVYEYQYYRIFTSAFLHGGILHIAMNMMSLVAMGGLLEPTYGSLRFLWMTWASIFLTAFCYIFFAWLSSVLMQDTSYMNSNSIGYSGVLFSYTAIESFHASSPYRSVFGLFSVPTKIYPIILLIVIQFVLPNISFFGHLGGLCAGMLLISSVGEYCVMPSLAAFEKMETSFCCSACRRQSSFRLLTNASLLHPLLEIRCQRSSSGASDNYGMSSFVQGIVGLVLPIVVAVGYVLVTVGQLLYTICYIFGFPIDACLHSVQQAYGSLQRYVSNCYTRIRGFFAGSNGHPGDVEAPADPTNATASQRSRLVSVPTVISSTPFSRPSASSVPGGSDGTGSSSGGGGGGVSSGSGGGGGIHSSASSSLAQAALRLGGGSFANYGGYEMVSQDIPESHATNSPLQPTSTAATASQRASTMLETMEDDDEAVAAPAAATLAPKATSAVSTTTATKTSAATATADNVQYYHRSKQTSRLLNPELYSANATNNNSSSNSNSTPRPPGGNGAQSTPR